MDFHISVREFLPIVIAFEIWGHLFSNSTVVLHVDNLAVVYVINKNSSKDPSLMELMRRLMVLSLTQNIHFRAKQIEGVNNIDADLLSQLQVKAFQTCFPYMDPTCTTVSPALISQTSEFLFYSSLSPSTVAAYKSAFQSYKLFVPQTYGQSTPPLPPRLEHLTSSIAHCFQSNLSASTTRTIVYVFTFFDTVFSYLKNAASFKKVKPTCDPRLPITP